ncbi:MAG: hypothetical protein P0120_04070 [Nitrospira sp.]|nr:hypothetical protein [Nitrospira sp.]
MTLISVPLKEVCHVFCSPTPDSEVEACAGQSKWWVQVSQAVLFSLAVSTTFFLSAAAASQAERPVVVVPGILGSKLCDGTGKVVWGKNDSLFNFSELKLPFQIDYGVLNHKPCGLIENIQILGPFQLHQYDSLLRYLMSRGYRLNEDLRVFSYDWRLSNYHNAEELRKYIAVNLPDETKQIDIVAHSMGGLIARIYVQNLGGVNRVHNLIFLGTPHRGSASVFRMLDQGWGFWQNLAAGGLASIRETVLTFPSIYQLLPSYRYCCAWKNETSGQIERTFESTDQKSWMRFAWLPGQFKNGQGRDGLFNLLREASELQDLMIQPLPEGLRSFNIVTGLIDTPWKTFFGSQSGAFAGAIPYPGDGTVIDWSAANGVLSEARPSTAEHGTIFDGDAPRQAIKWLLGTDTEPRKGIPLDYRGVLRDAKGRDFNLINIFYETEPNVSVPGTPTVFRLRLRGELALAKADLRNVELWLDDETGGHPLQITRQEVVTEGNIAQHDIAAAFASPTESGPHSVNVKIPGAGTFADIVFVLR